MADSVIRAVWIIKEDDHIPGNLATWLFILTSVLALGASWRPATTQPKFLITDAQAYRPASVAHFQEFMAGRPDGVQEVHGSTLAVLPNDELLMVYYGGTYEAALDVKLYQARFSKGSWQAPTLLLTPEQVGEATHRYTRRVGNCSLYRDAQGRLHLFFVTVGYFGWSCSSINQMSSHDDGKTWDQPVRLLTTPLINISTLVRSPAVPLASGGFLLPVYYELTNKFPEALEFDAAGKMVRKTRMTGEHGYIQACLAPSGSSTAHAYLRNRNYDVGKLGYQRTEDGGRTWTTPTILDVENNDSPVAVARLGNDCFIMAYNPTYDREILRLAASTDGIHWRDIKILDQAKLVRGQGMIEFSYPTMIVHNDVVDLVYTWHRRGFRHVRFTTAWLKEQLRD